MKVNWDELISCSTELLKYVFIQGPAYSRGASILQGDQHTPGGPAYSKVTSILQGSLHTPGGPAYSSGASILQEGAGGGGGIHYIYSRGS